LSQASLIAGSEGSPFNNHLSHVEVHRVEVHRIPP